MFFFKHWIPLVMPSSALSNSEGSSIASFSSMARMYHLRHCRTAAKTRRHRVPIHLQLQQVVEEALPFRRPPGWYIVSTLKTIPAAENVRLETTSCLSVSFLET